MAALPWKCSDISNRPTRHSFLSWAWTCCAPRMCRWSWTLVCPSCSRAALITLFSHTGQRLAGLEPSLCPAASPTAQPPGFPEPLCSAAPWWSCGEVKTSKYDLCPLIKPSNLCVNKSRPIASVWGRKKVQSKILFCKILLLYMYFVFQHWMLGQFTSINNQNAGKIRLHQWCSLELELYWYSPFLLLFAS